MTICTKFCINNSQSQNIFKNSVYYRHRRELRIKSINETSWVDEWLLCHYSLLYIRSDRISTNTSRRFKILTKRKEKSVARQPIVPTRINSFTKLCLVCSLKINQSYCNTVYTQLHSHF